MNILTEVPIERPSLRTMMILCCYIVRMAGNEDALDIKGICHVLLNRKMAASAHRLKHNCPHPTYGSGGWLEVCAEIDPNQTDLGQDFTNAHAVALSSFVRILDTSVPDPTCGATMFHAHRIEPEWASSATPTALMTDLVFYRT